MDHWKCNIYIETLRYLNFKAVKLVDFLRKSFSSTHCALFQNLSETQPEPSHVPVGFAVCVHLEDSAVGTWLFSVDFVVKLTKCISQTLL